MTLGSACFLDEAKPPAGFAADEFSDEAVVAYQKVLGKDNADLIERVAGLADLVESLGSHASESSLRTMRATTTPDCAPNEQNADFV